MPDTNIEPTVPEPPNRTLVKTLRRACSGDDGRASRARLRRALTNHAARLEALLILGPAVSDKASPNDVTLMLGVASLYAKYAPEGATGTPWRNLGHAVRAARKPIDGARARSAREVQRLKARLDEGDADGALRSLRQVIALATVDGGHIDLDWGLLFADLRNLLRGRQDPKSEAAWNRWCVGLAVGPQPEGKAVPSSSTTSEQFLQGGKQQ